MSKEITKSFILQEITDKFKLREWEPERFTFSEQVVPVYNIEQHLKTWEVVSNTLSMTSAAAFTFFTVPQNERWVLRGYQIIYGATGAHKGTGLFLSYRPEGTDIIYLDMTKGQEISYCVNLPILVTIEPKTRIKYLIDTYTSAQDLTVDIDVQKERIR